MLSKSPRRNFGFRISDFGLSVGSSAALSSNLWFVVRLRSAGALFCRGSAGFFRFFSQNDCAIASGTRLVSGMADDHLKARKDNPSGYNSRFAA